MSFTRAFAEAATIPSVGEMLAWAGYDGTTKDGTNADLDGPFLDALYRLGLQPAGSVVADADLTPLTVVQQPRFLLFAKRAALLNALASPKVDIKEDDYAENYTAMTTRIDALLTIYDKEILSPLGLASNTPTITTILAGTRLDPNSCRVDPRIYGPWPYPGGGCR